MAFEAAGRSALRDTLPPWIGIIKDVSALLRFAATDGFLHDALVSSVVSDYPQLRNGIGLRRYCEDEMIARLMEKTNRTASASLDRQSHTLAAEHRNSVNDRIIVLIGV